jgi:hypothetical protein
VISSEGVSEKIVLRRKFGLKWNEIRAGGSVVGIISLAGRSRVRFPVRSFAFAVGVILPAALCPWVRLSL